MTKATKIYDLDVDRLHEVLDYDPETGVFTWRVRTGPMCKLGSPAGRIGADGYRSIGLDRKTYKAHQLAWLHVHGEPPDDELDFINGDKSDIRLVNLRPATRADNARNANRPSNSTGYRGVKKFHNRFHAVIRHGGKRHFIGTFATAEEAYEAYCAKAKELHGEFARFK